MHSAGGWTGWPYSLSLSGVIRSRFAAQVPMRSSGEHDGIHVIHLDGHCAGDVRQHPGALGGIEEIRANRSDVMRLRPEVVHLTYGFVDGLLVSSAATDRGVENAAATRERRARALGVPVDMGEAREREWIRTKRRAFR